MKRTLHALLWPAIGVVILDQATKLAIMKGIRLHDVVPVVEGLFNLVQVRNRGMAFGLFNRPDGTAAFLVLTAASLLAMALLILWYRRLGPQEAEIVPGLGLVLGGAAGNLIDRIRLGEVVDFLDFYIGEWHWPAFNVADSAITVGTFWIALYLLFQPKVRG